VTIILTTHYLFEAQEMCDRIAIINKGNLVALDTTKKLLERIKKKKIIFKLKKFESNLALNLPNVKFLIESDDTIAVIYEKESIDFEQLINYLKEKNLKIQDISIDEGDLEDVFIQLTKN
jgi:ABC-type multidrug transport system, ATPase component